MANKARSLIVAGVLAIVGTASPLQAAGPDRPVLIYVDNYAHVPAARLAGAESEASRIYLAAGVPLAWASDEGAAAAAGGRLLRVVILSREMSERKIASDGVGPQIVGQASRTTARAYIFYDRVIERAARIAPSVETMLGWVLAHEVGHLLLPQNSHSDLGIMRATFDRRNLVKRFTPAQSRSLQQLLAAPVTIAAR